MIDFSKKYNREEVLEFLKGDFLKDFQKDIRKVGVSRDRFIKDAFSLGSSKDLELGIFEFEHTGSTEKRVSLTKEAFQILKESGFYRALAFFHSKDTDDWRFSFMTITPTLTEKGKIKKEFSNPKRFSFLLGPRAKVNTPTQFLIKKGPIESLDDLKERFSIEVVNKEFYKKISELFVELVGGELGTGRSKVTYEGLLQLPGVKPASKEAQEFAVRLIGRLIFCWFLREKKNGSEDSLMPNSLLSYEASEQHTDYYHEVLEPIFFKVLNVPIDSRKEERYSTDPYAKIPYLNGGLFTPHEDDYYSNIDSKEKEYRKEVLVPDEWIQKLFKILETYNFTIDENSSFDEELSIDPEMLGRIFENLLAEINPETGKSARKSTGSFYTPRVIVDYMVDESLYLYLKGKTDIKEEKLRALVSYDLDDDEDNPLENGEKENIIDAIDELTILDPACGSGAFPMGVLQKIVFILQQLDPNGQFWFKKQIENVPVELRKNLEREHEEENFDYIRKLGVIRKNIFGVDIQPIATEISRLRCFLTLVVDQKVDNSKDNRGIVRLPNLDFKFVTANTLVPLPGQKESAQTIGIFEDKSSIDSLKRIRDQFFNATNHERIELKDQFKKIRPKMPKYYNTVKGAGAGADLTEILLSWEPFSHKRTDWFDPEWIFGIKEGFDIVIGNPPYIKEYVNRSSFDGLRNSECYQGKMDIWYLFSCKGIDLLKTGTGVLAFIAQNNWITSHGASKMRNKILSDTQITTLLDFNDFKIFSAGIQTMIMLFKKDASLSEYHFDFRRLAGNDLNFEDVLKLLKREKSKFTEYLYPLIKRNQQKNQVLTFNDQKTEYVLKKIKSKGNFRFDANKEIAQGIVPNPDVIGVRNIKKIPIEKIKKYGIKKGDGVFVLPKNHFKNLNNYEKLFLKPLYEATDLRKYSFKKENTKEIMYITNAVDKTKIPTLLNHLKKYREIMDSRRENKLGRLSYYHLHWPRDEYFFKSGPKILSVRKCSSPTFVYTEEDAYVMMSINVIRTSRINQKYLVGLLNSTIITFWLKYRGKMQGKNFQIDTEPLTNLPICMTEKKEQEYVSILVEGILNDSNNSIAKYQKQIDKFFYRLYDLTKEEIELVEKLTRN